MTVSVNTETGEIRSTINYEIHPAANWFPLMEGAAFQQMVEDIREHGQEVPVVLDAEGRLLDGRNRARACQALGIDVKETRYTGDDPVGFVISHNVHRRHLTESQRAMVAAKMVTFKQGGDRGNQYTVGKAPIGALPNGTTQRDAATALNVSRNSVQRATVVLDHGTPETRRKVEAGELTVNKAAEAIKAAREPLSTPARPTVGPLPLTQRVEEIRELADKGATSAHIAKALGASENRVREIARKNGVLIIADEVRGKVHRLNHDAILANAAEAVEVAAMGLNDIDPARLDREEGLERLDSLTHSINAIATAIKKIKESLQ